MMSLATNTAADRARSRGSTSGLCWGEMWIGLRVMGAVSTSLWCSGSLSLSWAMASWLPRLIDWTWDCAIFILESARNCATPARDCTERACSRLRAWIVAVSRATNSRWCVSIGRIIAYTCGYIF